MIKENVEHDTVAIHEFDVEHGMLCRFNHPNIIKLYGAGRVPRRFIALEWLGGGTLNAILQEHQVAPGFTKRLFRKPSFTYAQLLTRAREIASALDYLHANVHPGVTIIHRDLKPDNIGFTKDGKLKLLDFGLCTCVKRRSSPDDNYEMTGNTGSLRYMAPEVALRQPYSEKADVYSYGVMIWQMARDQVPYKGMNKAEFLQRIAIKGERPKADKSWPSGFTALLEACWHSDPAMRPSFESVTAYIDALSENKSGRLWSKIAGGPTRIPSPMLFSNPSQKNVTSSTSKEDTSNSSRRGAAEARPSSGAPRSKEESQSSWF
eukprot:gene38249-50178_t